MSVKGVNQILFVGQNGIRIEAFLKKDITVGYEDMEKVKYRYADSCGNGYMVFTTVDDISYTFSYKEQANEPMSRAVSYIQEHSPNTKIEFIAQSAIKDDSAPSAYMESYPKISLTITSGKQFLKVNTLFNIVTIKRMPDGFVTFGNDNERYSILWIDWAGAEYRSITTTNLSGTERTKAKGKAKEKGLWNSRVKASSVGKTNYQNSEHSISRNFEVESNATMKVQKESTGNTFVIGFVCTSKIYAELQNYIIEQEDDFQEPSEPVSVDDKIDSIRLLKEYKDLFDSGIITEEEFLKKKEELL